MPPQLPFRFKRFEIAQQGAAHPVGTDAVLLGAWADVHGAKRVLDIGTGTGVVALMLAQRTEQQEGVNIVGVEPYTPSVVLARQNFDASPWAARMSVWEGRIQDYAMTEAAGLFDLIVSNPPFFTEATWSPHEARQMSRHAAHLPVGDLLQAVRHLLKPDGRCCVILPPKLAQILCEQAVLSGLYWTKITSVRPQPENPVKRWLLELSRQPLDFEKNEWQISGECAAYRMATAPFYLF